MKTSLVRTADDGRFPNSPHPVVLHRGVEVGEDAAPAFEELFAGNGWTHGWRAGLYAFHHYHSTAHEALGVFAGSATLQLGGPEGETVDVEPGDVIVIPAGVAHRCVDDRGLRVVGAYDRGLRPDLMRGEEGERPDADARIAAVPLPHRDPALGGGPGGVTAWR